MSVEEAQARILAAFEPAGTETVQLSDSPGRILGRDVAAPADQPLFANSSMDGFAVRAADLHRAARPSGVVLQIVADIPAGSFLTTRIGPGQAARIMTGAPLPEGADAVVPIEDTNFSQSSHLSDEVAIYREVQAGDYVRWSGEDFQKGQVLLNKGRRLQPQDVGVLASIGQAGVVVHRRPRVALFSSGDELVSPGEPLSPGQIYEVNQPVLASLLEYAGAEVLRLGIARDDPAQIEERLGQGVKAGADLLVSSAGVSVGAFDYVRQVIESRGELSFWRVNMRPGKPLAFGAFSGAPLIGLPGNPVSAYVGCRVFVLPAVYKLAGRPHTLPRSGRAVLAESIQSDGRESYLRGLVSENHPDGNWTARLAGHQGSGNLFGLTQANALLIVPSGVKSLPSGSEVNFWFLETE